MARDDGSKTIEDGDVMVDGGDLCRIEQLPWTLTHTHSTQCVKVILGCR